VKNPRKYLLKLLSIVILTLGAGVALGQEPIDAFRVAIPSDPETLDPHKVVSLAAIEVTSQIYDRLIYIAEDGSPQPWLAESWQVDETGTEMVFKLREGLVFHDGTPLDAAAVEHSFDRLLNATWPSAAQTALDFIDSVEVLDELTVALTLADPYAPAFTMLDHPYAGIVPPSAASLDGNDNMARQPVGSGPFMVESYTPGGEIVLRHNPDYVNYRADVSNPGAPYIESLRLRIIGEEGTALMAFEADELDLIPAPLQDLPWIEEEPGFKVVVYDRATNFTMIEFNSDRQPFDNRNVRRAVGFALDQEEIVDIAWGGYARVNHNPMPTGVPGFDPALGKQFGFPYDPERAAELLEAEGWKLADDGVRYRDGKPLRVRFLSFNADFAERAATSAQYQLEQVGFDVDLEVMDTGIMINALRSGDSRPNMNLMRFTWPDPAIMHRMFRTPGWTGQYNNPELDSLLDEVVTTVAWEPRLEAIREAQKSLLEYGRVVPIASDIKIVVTEPEVEGLQWANGGLLMFQDVHR
jgi:peptide/nickel transport system substrate-binding protein